MDTTTKKNRRQRLYRIWLSCVTEGKFQEFRCEVIAREAAKAIQAVMSKHEGIDVIVATIEQVAALDRAITVDEEK